MMLSDALKKLAPAPKPASPAPAASAPKAASPSTPSASAPQLRSGFQPAASKPLVNLNPWSAPPPTTLRTERVGDGQANCLERAASIAGKNDRIVLFQDTRDSSGHAVVQHPDGSVTDPNNPSVTYPDLGAWNAAHPSYRNPVAVSAAAVQQVLALPPGSRRDAEIKKLGLDGVANLSVADEDTYVQTNTELNLRAQPDASSDSLGLMPEGSILRVVTPPEEGSAWAQVEYTNLATGETTTGWAHIEEYTDPLSAEEAQVALAQAAADGEKLQSANDHYVDQLAAEGEVSYPVAQADGSVVMTAGDQRNANCGPSSLVIAFREQNLTLPEIPGIDSNGTDGADVQAARFAMYGVYEGSDPDMANANKDGVEPVVGTDGAVTYQYAPMAGGENSTLTGFDQMIAATKAAGGNADYLQPSGGSYVQPITDALNAGQTVIISGDFTEQVPVMATPDQPHNELGQLIDPANNDAVVMQTVVKSDTWAQGGGATQHIVAVTGMTSDGNFIVADPIHPTHAPIVVTPAELDAFMRGNASAIFVDGTP